MVNSVLYTCHAAYVDTTVKKRRGKQQRIWDVRMPADGR